jgi:hypothetical protein
VTQLIALQEPEYEAKGSPVSAVGVWLQTEKRLGVS